MEKMIIINQKMYINSLDKVYNFIKMFDNYKKRIVVIPSYIYIKEYIQNNFIVGSQNVSDETFGAYTGEVSAQSLKNIGVSYTLIGHSEVRQKYKDENDRIVKKIKNSLNNDLKVILCIGESKKERDDNKTFQVIDKYLLDIDRNVIISYEPIWSIGTNIIPSNEEIAMIVNYIKEKGFKTVLYGGSVNEDNIKKLNKIDVLDGFLIAGAVNNPESIIKMIEVV